jgi:hypothetical protein
MDGTSTSLVKSQQRSDPAKLNHSNGIFLQDVIVNEMVKKVPAFMEYKYLLLCSK